MLPFAFSEAHRSQQIALRLQQRQRQQPKSPEEASAGGGGGHKRSRRRRRQKKNKTASEAPEEVAQKQIPASKKRHDAPMTKRDLYFSLRCGMVGTGTEGFDAAVGRVTLVNWDAEVVLDDFIRLPVPVKEYRTSVTGITSENLVSESSVTMEEARARVGSLIKGKILIGHGLEVDLSVLGLTHPVCDVRDTASYAPFMKEVSDPISTMMLPKTLAELMEEVLHRDVHSNRGPVEEAIGCLDLYKFVRNEWESDLIRLAQQKERQRQMILSMRSGGPPLSSIHENDVVQKPSVPPVQSSALWSGDVGLSCVEYEESLASTVPTTVMQDTFRDDVSEASSFFSRDADTCSETNSYSRPSGISRIENMDEVATRNNRNIWKSIRTGSWAREPPRVEDWQQESARAEEWPSDRTSSQESGIWTPLASSSASSTAGKNVVGADWSQVGPSQHAHQSVPLFGPETPPQANDTGPPVSLTEEELMEHLPSELLSD